MLKKIYLYCSFLFFVCLLAAISGHSWEYEQISVMEGVLRRAERRRITRDSDGTEIVKTEKSVVLVTDDPVVFSHSVMIGKQQIASTEIAHSHIEVLLAKEFMPLIGKRVQCSGHFIRKPSIFHMACHWGSSLFACSDVHRSTPFSSCLKRIGSLTPSKPTRLCVIKYILP